VTRARLSALGLSAVVVALVAGGLVMLARHSWPVAIALLALAAGLSGHAWRSLRQSNDGMN
jgi:membrane protein implicated in regulation of membrane protease activity